LPGYVTIFQVSCQMTFLKTSVFGPTRGSWANCEGCGLRCDSGTERGSVAQTRWHGRAGWIWLRHSFPDDIP
jgi:hypothetical protein